MKFNAILWTIIVGYAHWGWVWNFCKQLYVMFQYGVIISVMFVESVCILLLISSYNTIIIYYSTAWAFKWTRSGYPYKSLWRYRYVEKLTFLINLTIRLLQFVPNNMERKSVSNYLHLNVFPISDVVLQFHIESVSSSIASLLTKIYLGLHVSYFRVWP